MRCAALTCRSYYSLLRGAVSVQRLAACAREYGYDAVAIADVNAMHGAVDLINSAQKYGLMPIIGVEILADTQRAVLLAENRTGHQNLCRITTARNLNERFDLLDQLQAHNEGVICICSPGLLLKELACVMPHKNLFAGCSNACQVQWAKSKGIRPAASGDFNIIDGNDIAIAKILSRIRHLSVAGAGPRDNAGVNRLLPADQFQAIFADEPQAITNNTEIMYRCDFDLLDGRLFLPKVKLAGNTSSDRELARLCHVGAAQRYGVLNKDILRRLENELSVIRSNGFCDYFLVVRDIVEFARKNGIPVDVRGSAAGSLVSYVLGFTRVCPIENNLYFERFMNPGRTDCPDIDVDLCWRRRDEVIRFCYEHWGYDKVAMISTLNRYRVRSAIRDAGRALGLSPVQINELIRRRKDNPERGIYRIAEKLIDVPRHVGVHCGGIVIAPEAIESLCPLQMAAKGVIVTQYDKDAAEAAGLIKIDLLGNRSLSTVNEAVAIICGGLATPGRVDSQPTGNLNAAGGGASPALRCGNGGASPALRCRPPYDLHTPLDIDCIDGADEQTAQMLSAGDSFGVFQCESPGMRQLLRGLKIRNRHDVAIALSLIRPGPAAGGMKNEYIQRHVYKREFEYLHPKLKDIFGDTYGVMLYQEDVMRLAVEVAGYSVAEADRFRSEVSKKVPPQRLQRQYIDFVYSRAEAAGIDRQTAEAIWDNILHFAAYSYCKAHATVYANIAWQSAYLKAHFPLAFYTSLLNNHHGMYPLRVYVWDAIHHGIRVLGPHVNKSSAEWSTEGNTIRAGLGIIKGLSYSAIDSIIRQRRIKPFSDLSDLRRRLRLSRRQTADLIHIGACDGLGNSRPAMLIQLNYTPTAPGQLTMFQLLPNPSTRQLPDYDTVARLKAEIDVSGIPFCMHPEGLLRQRHVRANRLYRFINREVTVAGFIATARKARTSDGRIMGFVTLEDSSGLAEISFFADAIDKYCQIASQPGPVWIRGRVSEHLSSITIECKSCGAAA